MSQQELLKRVIQTLKQSRIQYMVTGSVASSLQGEPRSTHDIDLVIAMHELSVKRLTQNLQPTRFYLDENSILDAIKTQSMFNIIDLDSGDKVDFWILTEDPFDQSRFSRKINETFMGMELQVSTPEDTILAKLRWAKLSGGSEKQFTDALRVYEVQHGGLDIKYLELWIKKLDIQRLWKRLVEEAEII